jgi:hypothetical protein
MEPYNGYSGAEREAKLTARNQRAASGLPTHPPGPCSICHDPAAPVEAHSEDYSLPYLWEPPGDYAICRTCHRNKLHKRFSNPLDWEAWIAHVRRGGYASDLKKPAVAKELEAFKDAKRQGSTIELVRLRPRDFTGTEWWETLRMDTESLTDPSARPRP